MPKKKKPFIDKKNAVTYHLIHRSQKDPLQADQDAPQRVLVTSDELSDVKKKERLATYGIYYDDDYDYEQHLRDVSDINAVEPDIDLDLFRVGTTAKSNVTLPTEVLPSQTEENIGMLDLAAPVSGPRLDWDPEIVAALDSDNEELMDEGLEDNFIELANDEADEYDDDTAEVDDRRQKWITEQLIHSDVGRHSDLAMPPLEQLSEDLSSDFGEDSGDEVGSLPNLSDDDNKTRFTNYSMSSSVIRRNEGLSLVDEKFEQLFAEYDDDEIGALDHEDIDGKVSTTGPMMEYLLHQFEKQQIKQKLPSHDATEAIEICSDSEPSDEETEFSKVVVEEGQKWDCESILSTYSNLYNHPKTIEEPWKMKSSGKIKLTKKLGIPLESLPQKGLTKKQLQALDRETEKILVNPARRKEETAEEKKARKAAIKQERKERRIEKKNTKLAFRQEEASQKKNMLASKNNYQGSKLI